MKYEVKTELARKCSNIAEVENEINDGFGEYAVYDITTIFELSHDDFNKFQQNLLHDYTFIKGFEEEVFLVVEKNQDFKTGLVIDPQGFSYARYVGNVLSIRKTRFLGCFVNTC